MTLRILKKRDGSEVLQMLVREEGKCDGPLGFYSIPVWQDVPTVIEGEEGND